MFMLDYSRYYGTPRQDSMLDYSRYYGTITGCESSARVSLSRVIGGLGRCFNSLRGQPSNRVDIRKIEIIRG